MFDANLYAYIYVHIYTHECSWLLDHDSLQFSLPYFSCYTVRFKHIDCWNLELEEYTLICFRDIGIIATEYLKMGAKCCRCHRGSVESVHDSVVTLTNLEIQTTDLKEMTVEEAGNDVGPLEQRLPSPTLEPLERNPPSPTLELSEIAEIVEIASPTKELPTNLDQDGVLNYEASNILWSTGSFSDPLPNGFYSVIPVKRFTLSKSIPTLEELDELGDERLKADVICVDLEKDKKLVRIKDLIIKLVIGLDSKSVKVTKKIAALVAEVYKGKTLQSPEKARQSFKTHGFPLLGQIRYGSCRARAIFFKVLADTVGLESRLVVGFPSDLRSSAGIDSYNHMSVVDLVVVYDMVEMLVDLKSCPGQLIPFSPEAVYRAHNSVAWQADFVNNDSCVSPFVSDN